MGAARFLVVQITSLCPTETHHKETNFNEHLSLILPLISTTHGSGRVWLPLPMTICHSLMILQWKMSAWISGPEFIYQIRTGPLSVFLEVCQMNIAILSPFSPFESGYGQGVLRLSQTLRQTGSRCAVMFPAGTGPETSVPPIQKEVALATSLGSGTIRKLANLNADSGPTLLQLESAHFDGATGFFDVEQPGLAARACVLGLLGAEAFRRLSPVPDVLVTVDWAAAAAIYAGREFGQSNRSFVWVLDPYLHGCFPWEHLPNHDFPGANMMKSAGQMHDRFSFLKAALSGCHGVLAQGKRYAAFLGGEGRTTSPLPGGQVRRVIPLPFFADETRQTTAAVKLETRRHLNEAWALQGGRGDMPFVSFPEIASNMVGVIEAIVPLLAVSGFNVVLSAVGLCGEDLSRLLALSNPMGGCVIVTQSGGDMLSDAADCAVLLGENSRNGQAVIELAASGCLPIVHRHPPLEEAVETLAMLEPRIPLATVSHLTPESVCDAVLAIRSRLTPELTTALQAAAKGLHPAIDGQLFN